jgi:hypothetical protein
MPATHVVFRRKCPLAGLHSKAVVWGGLLSANVALSLPLGPEQTAAPLITHQDSIGSSRRQMTFQGFADHEQMQRAHHLSHIRRPVEGATNWRDPNVASL